MKTDKLINVLAGVNLQKKPLPLTVVLIGFSLATAGITYLLLGLRPELRVGVVPSGFWVKTLILAIFAIFAGYLLQMSTKPQAFILRPLTWVPMLVSFLLLIVREWIIYAPATILDPSLIKNYVCCVSFVTIYGVIGSLIFIRFMRHFVMLDTKHSGQCVGMAAAGCGAIGYSFHCPADSPTFIAFAYGIPVILIGKLAKHWVAKKLEW